MRCNMGWFTFIVVILLMVSMVGALIITAAGNAFGVPTPIVYLAAFAWGGLVGWYGARNLL